MSPNLQLPYNNPALCYRPQHHTINYMFVMECCNDEDFCNERLSPKLTPRPEGKAVTVQLHFLIPVSLYILFSHFILFAFEHYCCSSLLHLFLTYSFYFFPLTILPVYMTLYHSLEVHFIGSSVYIYLNGNYFFWLWSQSQYPSKNAYINIVEAATVRLRTL